MENTQYQPQAPQPAPEAAMPKTAMGITPLVLGIIAIVSSWMPIVITSLRCLRYWAAFSE